MLAGTLGRPRAGLWALLFASHLAAVLWSRGYHHPDEHFQVLQFIDWRLGKVPTSSMPWELPEGMRPWLHVGLFLPVEWLSARCFELSPFTRTAIHRACVAALALFTIHRSTRERDPRLLLLYATLYFFPFLDVRMSSEVIGGWLVALAYTLDGAEEPAPSGRAWALGIGLLLGMAGVVRLQAWSMVAGGLLFHALRRDVRRLVWQTTGIGLVGAASVLVDSWGYGEFTVVPWNYVRQNLLLGKSADFGISPVYAYVPMLLEGTFYLPGLVLLAAMLWQWIRCPRSKLSFMTLPFMVLHTAIAHKELRFLFSLAPFAPLAVLGMYSDLVRARRLRPQRWLRPAAKVFLLFNLLLLVPFSTWDAAPRVGLYSAMLEHSRKRREKLYYVGEESPQRLNSGLYFGYYLGRKERSVQRVESLLGVHSGQVVTRAPDEYLQLRSLERCTLLASHYPKQIMDTMQEFHSISGLEYEAWALWRCRRG